MKVAVYPGTFDPLTIGHLDIIKRSSKIFDKVIILINHNPDKKTLLSIYERTTSIKLAIESSFLSNVDIDVTESKYTVTYCKENNASFLIRGLRNSDDFSYEENIATINKEIDPDIETIFILANRELGYISSSMVKGLCKFEGWEGTVKKFLPITSYQLILEKFQGGLSLFKNALETICGNHNSSEYIYHSLLLESSLNNNRYYHTIVHFLNGLNVIDKFKINELEKAFLTIAFFYHDYYYDAEYSDDINIKKSIEKFLDNHKATFDNKNKDYVDIVCKLIQVTDHKTKPNFYLEKCIIDMDLIGFSVPYEEYLSYSLFIRKEYGKYQDDEWLKGRKSFLESIINKPLFHVHPDKEKLEQIFKDNITRDLKYINSKLV